MTLSVLFLRFLIAYLGFMVLAGLTAGLLGVRSGTGINMGVLAGVVIWVCSTYAQKNGRRIAGKEKSKVVLLFAAGNLLVQLIGVLVVLDEPALLNRPGVLIISISFAALIQAIAIYFFVGLSQWILKKCDRDCS
jgi:hypothetical protein